MKSRFAGTILRLLFYWTTSFGLAVAVYYALWVLMPGHHVFGQFFRMWDFHRQHPLAYIAIPCFFYGILATAASGLFYKMHWKYQLPLTIVVVVLTVFLSSPFGGMLYYYHDMQAGYFPSDWGDRMLRKGIEDGFSIGWIIVLLSIPYNLIGTVTCLFLTRIGAGLFRDTTVQGSFSED